MDKNPIDPTELDEQLQNAMERDRARMPSFAEKPNDKLLGILAGAAATKSVWTLFGTKIALLATGAAVVATTWYLAKSPNESPSPNRAVQQNQQVPSTSPTDEPLRDTLQSKSLQPSHIKTSLPSGHNVILPQSKMQLDDSDRNNVPTYTDSALRPKKHR